MRKASSGHRYQLEIYRSRFKFPPSAHPVTLGLFNSLATSKDLDIFESRLVQIFIELKWKKARYYFLIEAFLVLVALVFLFLHSARYRGPAILMPLIMI